MLPRRLGALLLLAGLAACAAPPTAPPGPAAGAPAPVPVEQPTYIETGFATFYGRGHHGHPTASGEIFDMHAMTAAHRHLLFGGVVRVTNLDNGKMVKVRINDRGPFTRDRIIDLSADAAKALGIAGGSIRVRLETYRSDQPAPKKL